jgi:hypothetical protein
LSPDPPVNGNTTSKGNRLLGKHSLAERPSSELQLCPPLIDEACQNMRFVTIAAYVRRFQQHASQFSQIVVISEGVG